MPKRANSQAQNCSFEAVTRAAICERLQKACKDADVSVRALALGAGLPQRTVANYIAGRGDPPVEVLFRLALELGISPNWLMLGEHPVSKGEAGSVNVIEDASEAEQRFLNGATELVRALRAERKQN